MFDKDMDRSLLYMLESDNEKRNSILNFILTLPDDVISQISTLLQENSSPSVIEEFGNYCYESGTIIGSDGLYYEWIIEVDEQEKMIEISKKIANSASKLNMNFGTTLTLVSEMPGYEGEIGEEMWFGDFIIQQEVAKPKSVEEALRKGFIPQLDITNGKVIGTSVLREKTLEYFIIQTATGHIVKRMDCSNSTSEILPISVEGLPTEITKEVLQKRYGDSPKVIQKV